MADRPFYDVPRIAGNFDQEREYYLRKIEAYYPELLENPELVYGDPKLEYLRLVNEGLIPLADRGEKGEKGEKGDKGNDGRDPSYLVKKTVPRLLVGANYRETDVRIPGDYYSDTYILEKEMRATVDVVAWYRALRDNTADDYIREIKPELDRNPDRNLMYALEIHQSNDAFLADFDSQGEKYNALVSLFTAIRETGYMDRVFLAPFHECNGNGSYAWQMFHPTNTNNSVQKYKECFMRVVRLAREMGITCKFIQWYLTGSEDSVESIREQYVGDQYVDLIGASYYNRSKAVGYGTTWTPPGNGLYAFARRVSKVTGNGIWVCESGCAHSNEYGDKGIWYSEMINLLASGSIPGIECYIMFMVNAASTDMRPENIEQKERIGRAIRAARLKQSSVKTGRLSKSLISPSIAIPRSTRHWDTTPNANLVVTISPTVPEWMRNSGTSLKITAPATPVAADIDAGVWHESQNADLDFILGKPHVMTVDMRSDVNGFKVSAGIRPFGSDSFAGERNISLSTQWETYTIPFATTADTSRWRFPFFGVGNNSRAGSVWATNIKIEPGHLPTPNVQNETTPIVRVIPTGAFAWNCEAADIWDYTLGNGDNKLTAPLGAAYDGQEIILRVRQPAGGGKTFVRDTSDSRLWTSSVNVQVTSAEFTITYIKLRYTLVSDKWGVTENVRHSFI